MKEVKLQAILDALPDIILRIDLDYRIVWANKAALDINPDAIGRSCFGAFIEREVECDNCVVKEAIETGRMVVVQKYVPAFKNMPGETYWENTGIPVRDTKGKLIGALEIFRNETERKKTRDNLQRTYLRLKELQDQLVQAEKMSAIGQLAGGVAHEVKNPLATIMHCADLLQKGTFTEKEKIKKLELIKNAVHSADRIVGSLLDFSKPSPIELKPAKLEDVLDGALELTRKSMSQKNIVVEKHIEKDLPPVMIDENQIKQVFINIFLNSIQAMDMNGKIKVSMSVTKFDKVVAGIVGRRETDIFRVGSSGVTCGIQDTGVGIKDENIGKVFEPFFTTKSPGGGTGLGLSVTASIIKRHKGLITVESEKAKGTKVVFTLQVADKSSV